MRNATLILPNYTRKLILLLLVMGPISGCNPLYFSSDKIRAKVVDAETGAPIDNAIVNINWVTKQGRYHGHNYLSFHLAEEITNAEGVFVVDEWGPKFSGMTWSMSASEPRLEIYKEGYFPFSMLSSSDYLTDHEVGNIPVEWNGTTIELKPVHHDTAEYANTIKNVKCGISFSSNWRQRPLCTFHIHLESARLYRMGLIQGHSLRVDINRLPADAIRFIVKKNREALPDKTDYSYWR